jgi:hypothetical protein
MKIKKKLRIALQETDWKTIRQYGMQILYNENIKYKRHQTVIKRPD